MSTSSAKVLCNRPSTIQKYWEPVRLAPTLVDVCGFIWEWTYAKYMSPLNTPGGIWGGVRVSQIQKSGKALKRLDRLAPNLAHICRSILEWIYAKKIAPRDTRGGTCGGGLGGQQFKSIGKLSDWHQLWFTSADSSGNGHRLNTNRPSISKGAFRGGGGLGCHKFKSLGRLSNGWIDWYQIWHTSADPSWNGYTPKKLPLETQVGHFGFFGVKHLNVWGSCQTAGPIGTNFGSRLRIHLGMDIG